MTTKISIVVPVYNAGKYLRRCIASFLNQHFPEIEIILINDASQDNSVEVAHRLCNEDGRIKLIDKKVNEGPMMARQNGIDTARGDYLMFCDADDWIEYNVLATMYETAKCGDVDLLIGDIQKTTVTGKHYTLNRTNSADRGAEYYLESIYRGTIPSMCGILFRTEYLRKHPISAVKNQILSEDRMWLTRLLMYNPKIKEFRKVVYNYFVNQLSTSHTAFSKDNIIQQINTLTYCYELMKKYRPSFVEIDKWISKYLLLYIENGVKIKKLYPEGSRVRKMVTVKNILSNIGWRAAAHYIMCSNSEIYCHLCVIGRHAIRKLQHKE